MIMDGKRSSLSPKKFEGMLQIPYTLYQISCHQTGYNDVKEFLLDARNLV